MKKFKIGYDCRESSFSGSVVRTAVNADEAIEKVCAQYNWSVVSRSDNILRICTHSKKHFYLDAYIKEVDA